MRPVVVSDALVLLCGDSKALDLGEGVIDAVVTDPPYELGFMGKKWDASGIAYDVGLWRAIYRALKPGGHLLAFGGTRTYHRMACAIEDAGFEIRDSLHWVYGSGFPKSLNVSKAIDDSLGEERPAVGANPNHRAVSGVGYEGVYAGGNTGAAQITAAGCFESARWEGWGTALKPAHEPIILARKPLEGTVAANVLAHGTGGLNVDGCRIGDEVHSYTPRLTKNVNLNDDGWRRIGETSAHVQVAGRWPANFVLSHSEGCEVVGTRVEKGHPGYPNGPGGNTFTVAGDPDGTRTDVHAPIPDRVVDAYRCAPGCPVAELDRQSGTSKSAPVSSGRKGKRPGGFGNVGAEKGDPAANGPQYGDKGGASRFFYVAKPSRRERDFGCEDMPARSGGEATDREDGTAGLENPRAGAGRTGGAKNYHPTVKPIELMRWLVRLVTPPGGVVLDPFTGSGTTGIAAIREGMSFVGVEQSAEYVEIAAARLRAALKEKEPCK